MQELLFGKLTLNDLPHEWFTLGGTVTAMLGGLALAIYLVKAKKAGWLWNDWLTSTDPKKIGIMYMIAAFFMFGRGSLDAVMIWLQQSLAASNPGYLSATHFQEIFSAHGSIMILFVTMGFLFGLLNIIIPLQIGARDVASPLLNTLGFWLYVAGCLLMNVFFVFGGTFSNVGWLGTMPLAGIDYNPGVGVDYWIWAIQISGLGTLLGGVNFIMTILKMRAPGMTLMKMPLFTWMSLFSMIMILAIFPILSATTALLWLDRFFGMHMFTSDMGGNVMMYTNLIWSWGHPEVYVLILPVYGIYSEIVATFSGKRYHAYTATVISGALVTFFSMLVWLHHFFTMGANADINSFFGIMTLLISIPTAMLVFNWLVTMIKGKIVLKTPMYWFLGFIATFGIGGVTGVMMGLPGIDYQVHNTLFLVAHFHNMVIGGALFGIFGGITYWFPKIAGFRLHEGLGKAAFWCWLIGFYVAFLPLYALGLMGAPRRMDSYDAATGWQPLFIVAFIGSLIIMLGVALQVLQIVVSIRQRHQLKDETGDPWDGHTLEWATHSPPPSYNFATVPTVTARDAFWEIKNNGGLPKPVYEDIHMPKNTAAGIYISGFLFLFGFAMVWHIHWLSIASFLGALVVFVQRAFDDNTSYIIPATEVARMEKEIAKARR
jgi:cytochrome o ubiquinol oxidase subunit I